MLLTKLFASSLVVVWLFCISTAAQTKPKESIDKLLLGHWESSEAKIEFRPANRITINGQDYRYTIVGQTIIVGNDEGQLMFPFKFADDVLTVWVENRKVVYTRMTDEEIKAIKTDKGSSTPSAAAAVAGSNPQDLVGKWCYQSNVNAQNGGRMSNICFTLNANGRYEYIGETTSSGTYGGSVSSNYDAGRWTATANSLTARSDKGKTVTYALERKNHPKTGDPMLIVDGDAFVTFYEKKPW